MKLNNKAFTLVELIVVVTILAILSTIGFVSYSGYLTGVRDTNRISQLKSISEGLNLYSTNHSLPSPDVISTDIMDGTTKIATQGYAGKNVLETINYSTEGVDPKDKQYFSYYLTSDKKYFQLMAFLEEEENLQNQVGAADYTSRYTTVFGDKLGILTDTNNNPLQETGTSSIDISNLGATEYISHFQDGDSVLGSGTTLSVLKNVAKVGGQFCGGSNLSCTNPNEVSDWRAIDPTCDIPDIVIGDQTWAGCNSTIGTGVEFIRDDTGYSCYDYISTLISGCDLSSDTKENLYNSQYGVDNIWGKFYTWDNSSTACINGYRVPTISELNTINDRKDLKIPMSGNISIDGNYYDNRGKYMFMWSSDAYDSLRGYSRKSSGAFLDILVEGYYEKGHKFSVRCIKDSE